MAGIASRAQIDGREGAARISLSRLRSGIVIPAALSSERYAAPHRPAGSSPRKRGEGRLPQRRYSLSATSAIGEFPDREVTSPRLRGEDVRQADEGRADLPEHALIAPDGQPHSPWYYVSSQVSAQFETAQRGLLAMLLDACARDRDEAPFRDVDQRQVLGDQSSGIPCRARCARRGRSSRRPCAISASSAAFL